MLVMIYIQGILYQSLAVEMELLSVCTCETFKISHKPLMNDEITRTVLGGCWVMVFPLAGGHWKLATALEVCKCVISYCHELSSSSNV